MKLDDPDRKIVKFGNTDEPGRLDTLDIYVMDTTNVQPGLFTPTLYNQYMSIVLSKCTVSH